MSEDKIASFDSLVAGKAGFEHGLVGRLAVLIKLIEPLAARLSCSLSIHRRLFHRSCNFRL
jgi:hypothetical protein